MIELQTTEEKVPSSDPEAVATEDFSSEPSEECTQSDVNVESNETDTTQWDNSTDTEDSDESDEYEPRR